MRAWKENLNFKELIFADQEIAERVPRKQIEHAFDVKRQLKNVDKIFARVFGKRNNGNAKKKSQKKTAR
jgi:adenylosuccinate lyase